MSKALFAMTSLLFLCGCMQMMGPKQIAISQNISFDLFPPQSFGRSIVLTQLAEISFSGESQEMLFVTEVTGDAITMVGLMTNGTRVFTIRYDGEEIVSDGYRPLLRRVQPAWLLADFQLSQWSYEQVNEQLRHSSPCLVTGACIFEQQEQGLKRILMQGSEKVMEIQFGGSPHLENSVDLSNVSRGYQINLTTIEVEQL